jgi:hypothetical protein
VLEANRSRIEAQLGDGDLVLDVGGWASPWPRADWVIDLLPHATRGLYGDEGEGPERFTADTWAVRDICDHTPWPFADDQFDFAVCSHTLEDIRDPVWVCAELGRVARAGYVETPSRLEEQSLGVVGPFVGWSHHHWLVDERDGGLEFTFKPHALHAQPDHFFSEAEGRALTAEERVVALFWEGSLSARERIFIEGDDLHSYLAEPVNRLRPELRRRAGLDTQAPRRSARRWWDGWRRGR